MRRRATASQVSGTGSSLPFFSRTGASSVHWSASVGKERMLEVMGRMHEGNPALLEKLLLHEL